MIKVPRILLIDDAGEKLGVIPTKEALQKAKESGLDLLLVAPNGRPPVAKLVDYGKMVYEKEKKEKDAKKKQKKQSWKEMKFRLRIDEHDFETKVRKIRDFLIDGQKVRAVIMFLGRDIMFKDKGKELLLKVIEDTSDIAKVGRAIKMAGRDMDVFLDPITKIEEE